MSRTAEFVTIGHPDKVADYISSYILDRFLEKDRMVKYAVEVMIKDNNVILGGEIKSTYSPLNEDILEFVKQALDEIGYSESYSEVWGELAINPSKIKVTNFIGLQSGEINQGLEGWGDQGVFMGYATNETESNLSMELHLAKRLGYALMLKAQVLENHALGLDIKTQITLSETGSIDKVVIAIPMQDLKYKQIIRDFAKDLLEFDEDCEVIINGTGNYTMHSSIADCGITGRKLAVDFYSLACPIGGGSPWTKDSSKADVTLNIYARKLAKEILEELKADTVTVDLACCIGRAELMHAKATVIRHGQETINFNLDITETPEQIIERLKLREPNYAKLCVLGINGQ